MNVFMMRMKRLGSCHWKLYWKMLLGFRFSNSLRGLLSFLLTHWLRRIKRSLWWLLPSWVRSFKCWLMLSWRVRALARGSGRALFSLHSVKTKRFWIISSITCLESWFSHPNSIKQKISLIFTVSYSMSQLLIKLH